MYKKFLSITLLLSMHALSAHDIQSTTIESVEKNESLISTSVEAIEENIEIEINETAQENTTEVEVNEQEIITQETEEVAVSDERPVEEVAQVTIEPTAHKLTYNFMLTPKASALMANLSEEATVDFNEFKEELGKYLVAMPEVEEFIAQHEVVYNEYKKFKGSHPQISVVFFILGDKEINDMQANLDKNNAEFAESLSDENKIKFNEAREDLNKFLMTALNNTLIKIGTRKFAAELVAIDKDQELLVKVSID